MQQESHGLQIISHKLAFAGFITTTTVKSQVWVLGGVRAVCSSATPATGREKQGVMRELMLGEWGSRADN